MTAVHDVRRTASRRLTIVYVVRAVFGVAWIALLLASPIHGTTPAGPGIALAALLTIYPMSDVVATVFDVRATPDVGRRIQFVNIAFGLAATAGIAAGIAISWSVISVVFGLWAIAAGFTMLVVAILRRRLVGGQLMMILSAVGSIFGGLGFVVFTDPASTVSTLAVYCEGGAFFYLIGALLLTSVADRVKNSVLAIIQGAGR